MTPDTSPIAEDVVKLIVTAGQAGSVDIGVVEVDVPVNIEDGNVVTESGGAHARVLQDPDHCVLLMRMLFWGIETRGIPFSHSNL